MENEFREAMSRHTDAELENIVNAPVGYYEQEGVEVAKQEIETRQLLREKIANYSTVELEYCLRRPDTREFQIATAEVQARRVPTHPKDEVNRASNRVGSSNNKYPALLTITKILQVVAVIFGAIAVISAFIAFAETSPLSGLLVLVGGGILSLFLVAMAEIIKVFIDIEHNTRNNSK